MGRIKTILVVALIIAAVVFGIRLFTPEDSWVCENGAWQKHGNPSSPMPTAVCESSQTPSPSASPSLEKKTQSSYFNTEMSFSLTYPQGAEVKDNLDGTVSVIKWGPTQKTQTEMFDGYSINIDQGTMGVNKNLQSLIEADIEQKKQQLGSDFKITKSVSSYSQNGFSYQAQDAFGEVTYIYLPQTSQKFLLLTVIVKDPGSHGFSQEVEGILSGITMTK